jgi:RimJ/RimL family protein N-acetyltransferase
MLRTVNRHRLDRIVLQGRHVRLAPLEPGHAEALFAAASESRSTYAIAFVPETLDAMRALIATTLEEESRGAALPFTVFDAAGAVIGMTRYMTVEWWTWPGPPEPPVPAGPDVLEIGGTWYAERVQRTPVNTEAKLLLCTHAFEVYGVRRVTWKTDARNQRSRNAILRLGARFDGVLRAHRVAADGVVRDTAYYSMLAAEWPEAKRALEARLGATSSSGPCR